MVRRPLVVVVPLAGVLLAAVACADATEPSAGASSASDLVVEEAPAALGSVEPADEVASADVAQTPADPVPTATTPVPRTEPATDGDEAEGTASPAAEPPTGAAVPAALDFTARRLGGGTVDGAAYAGRDVAIWMWAPWCPQCNREAEHVAEALDRWHDDVMFLGMPGHDDDAAHEAFLAEHDVHGMVQAVDDDGTLWARYGVGYQPAWVFVDEDGATEVVAGGLYDDLDARLQALVEE